MAGSTVVEMKVERSLLDANFEGYKLHLDSIPCFKKDYDSNLSAKSLAEDQFSYNCCKLFASYNVFVQDDKAEKNGVYLLDGASVCHITDKSQEGLPADITEIWKSDSVSGSQDSYNSSLVFASKEIAAFSDGNGILKILQTNDRGLKSEQWKCIYSNEICGPNRPFIISSASHTGSSTLHILLRYVEEKDKVEGLKDTAPNFVNIIEWITFSVKHDLTSIDLDRIKRYAFYGEIEYVELCKESMLFFGQDLPFQIVFDSAGGTIEDEMQQNDEKKNNVVIPKFFWYQGVEDMAIWVPLPENIKKQEIKVVLKPSNMSTKIRNEVVFEGKLWNVLDSDSMTWTIDAKKRRLEITVCKANVGMVWQRFLADQAQDGEEVMDPAMVDKIHEQLAHLTTEDPMPDPNAGRNGQVFNNQELEDCDENAEVSRAFILIKSSIKSNASPKVNVGDKQFLFRAPSLEAALPNVLCLRHDVDGLIWQPNVQDNGTLSFDHIDTFNAFGYVRASKTQTRFVVAPPSRSYVSIIDRIRHVYLYRKPEPISSGCELRNRKSGQQIQRVAKQQVPTLDHEADDSVIGACATNESLFISTKKALFCFKVLSE